MKFSKMHGLGNDFIIINNLDANIYISKDKIQFLCDRRFGIGADGLILVEKSKEAHIKMAYYNSDGNEVEMCGNGIRCFAKYVYDNQIIRENSINVETLAGIKIIQLKITKDKVSEVTVNMGDAIYEGSKIPIKIDKDIIIDEEIEFENNNIKFSCISMGNPHTIIVVDDLDSYPIEKIGSFFENNPIFPNKTNVNFVQVIDEENIKVITWERGVGLTLACGTGTCASVVLLNNKKLVNNKVNASLPGGKLIIQVKEKIYMTGKAEHVFDGTIEFKEGIL